MAWKLPQLLSVSGPQQRFKDFSERTGLFGSTMRDAGCTAAPPKMFSTRHRFKTLGIKLGVAAMISCADLTLPRRYASANGSFQNTVFSQAKTFFFEGLQNEPLL